MSNLGNEFQEPTQIHADPQQTIKLAEQDLNFLAGLCFAEHMQFLFPLMFIKIWEFLKSKVHVPRSFPKLAIGIPRGFAKTTLMKLWCVYVILFTTKRCIIIVSSIDDHAANIIRDVCEMLTHPNIISLFGKWDINRTRNQNLCKIFTFRGREIVLGGVGSKGTIRGLNIGNVRPDVMIFEDYQNKKDSENEELSESLYEEMIGTFMYSQSPFGCMFIFVANMYPTPGSILKKLKKNKNWTSIIVGAILEDGTSLWEDLQPIKQLLAEYVEALDAGKPQVFLAEKLNDENAGIKAGIDITKIPKFPFDIDELPQARGIVIDPALDNPNSDYNGIGLVGIFDGKPCLEKVQLGKYSPLELIKEALKMAFNNSTRLITVENAQYQASLLFWFTKVCADNGIQGFTFLPLNYGSGSKNGKIAAALKELVAKEVYIKDEVRSFVINEIIKWNPLKGKNQDTVLDLLTSCKRMIEQHENSMQMPYEAEATQLDNIPVLTEEENCEF